MAANVITPPQFSRGSTGEIRETDTVPIPDLTTIEELPLQEAQYGDTEMGTLTDDEASMFVDLYNATAEFDQLNRSINGGLMVGMGNDLKAGTYKPPTSDEEHAGQVRQFLNPDEMAEMFRQAQRVAMLKTLFYWQVGERIGCHDHSISIRTKRRIMRRSRKW